MQTRFRFPQDAGNQALLVGYATFSRPVQPEHMRKSTKSKMEAIESLSVVLDSKLRRRL
jgi:hypothetical protein